MSANERHYTVQEVAKLWHWSAARVSSVFFDEPGVMKYGHDGLMAHGHNHPRIRRYWTLSIPESVLVRVHDRYVEKKKAPQANGRSLLLERTYPGTVKKSEPENSVGPTLVSSLEPSRPMTELELEQAAMRGRNGRK